MSRDLLIAQITAEAPDIAGYQISAYLLEFLEDLKTETRQGTVSLSTFDNQGQSAAIPEKMTRVTAVYVNGLEAFPEMTEAEARYILGNYPDTYITDDNDIAITDDNDIPLEV